LTKYWTAPSITGPWTTNLVSVILPGDGANDSWSTQVDFVYAFKGTKDTVQMYDGDRWKQTETNRQGGYAWLPITFSSKDSIIINYYQDWEVEPELGLWRALDRNRDLAFKKTATASSTSGSNAASNVTDASTYSNYMSTKWTSESSDPQWISIDLGSAMSVNRVIIKWDSEYAKAFKIQVSTDNTAWTDVFSTTSAGQRCITDETFATTTARYVRMNGTQRGSTSGGYSMYEFMVLNDTGVNVSTLNSGKSINVAEALLTSRNNTIHYRVPSGNSVKLDVVDVRGKLVAVLVDAFKQAGNYDAVLPAALGRGMYIIRLTTGDTKLASMQVRW